MIHRADHFMTAALTGVLAACVIGSAPVQQTAKSEELNEKIEQSSEKRFTIAADPRMELLAVVQHFTSWAPGGHIKSQTAYKDDIDQYFEEFQNHQAMAMVEHLVKAGFTHDAPVAFMLHHGPPPKLEQKYPYSDYLKLWRISTANRGQATARFYHLSLLAVMELRWRLQRVIRFMGSSVLAH